MIRKWIQADSFASRPRFDLSRTGFSWSISMQYKNALIAYHHFTTKTLSSNLWRIKWFHFSIIKKIPTSRFWISVPNKTVVMTSIGSARVHNNTCKVVPVPWVIIRIYITNTNSGFSLFWSHHSSMGLKRKIVGCLFKYLNIFQTSRFQDKRFAILWF